MAASLSGLGGGPGASRLWDLSRSFLMLLLLLLLPPPLHNLGYKEDNAKPACGKPWWSEDVDMTRHWPWEVSLRLENEHVCGGALIDLSWVVTAAHCIQGTKEYSVILGTSKLKPADPKKTVSIRVKDIIMHPRFWGRTFTMGDIALLQLHTPAIFSKYVQPICLPEPTYHLKVGTQCWVTGWGQVKQRFSANSTLTPELQEAEVFIMDNNKCDQIYRKKSRVLRIVPLVLGDMICATNYGENLCYGDSGGPLACEVENGWILAGILSWEKACAKEQNPGVYTRVTKYSKWINKQMSSGTLPGPHSATWLLLLSRLLQPRMVP
ncbi:serine protease 45-like [Pteropus medius]|uniref:serine protease 45-like n=1 Tax=Pteropus vampyrus TaxID=132908 RepID=UPI00196AB8E6|nr:serine protease 45-like [Pteropus giganteus]